MLSCLSHRACVRYLKNEMGSVANLFSYFTSLMHRGSVSLSWENEGQQSWPLTGREQVR